MFVSVVANQARGIGEGGPGNQTDLVAAYYRGLLGSMRDCEFLTHKSVFSTLNRGTSAIPPILRVKLTGLDSSKQATSSPHRQQLATIIVH